MKNLLILSLSGALIALFLLISPSVLLWSINTISEQSDSSLYIPHGVWTYLACYGIILTVGNTRSGSKSK